METTQPSQPATSASAAPGRTTMQAIVQHRYGTTPKDVLRLEQVATPAIAANEVLVHVRAAAVDRGTWHLMAGQPYLMRLLGFGLRGPKTRVPGLLPGRTSWRASRPGSASSRPRPSRSPGSPPCRACAPGASRQGSRFWSLAPREASAATPCNWPRPSEQKSLACAAPRRRI
jgi:hypothetical protein